MEVNVNVAGECGSGKTIIAFLIKKYLSNHYDVVINDPTMIGDACNIAYDTFKDKLNKGDIVLGGRKININIDHV